MSDTVMLRARPATRALLRALADRQGVTAVEALDRLVQEAADRQLLDALQSDLAEHASGIASELAQWDHTAADGLESTEDFAEWR